jgi:hypothetical protein
VKPKNTTTAVRVGQLEVLGVIGAGEVDRFELRLAICAGRERSGGSERHDAEGGTAMH